MRYRDWLIWLSGHWSKNNSEKSVTKQIEICKLGIGEEAGEVLGCFKRMVRGDPRPRQELIGELGDVLHYLHRYMQLTDIDPEEVYQVNHDKLIERYRAKVVVPNDGSADGQD